MPDDQEFTPEMEDAGWRETDEHYGRLTVQEFGTVPDVVERCPRCGERLYSPAETETHNRNVHNFGPVGTVWAEAEPETRQAL